MLRTPAVLVYFVLLPDLLIFGKAAVAETLQVSPASVLLDRPEATQQIMVHQADNTGRVIDVTRNASLKIEPPDIATVDDRGLISPLANGVGLIVVEVGDTRTTLPITVTPSLIPVPISFRREIIPILTKAGCNSGGCHGKAEGQNGFRLSIFGFDTRSDFESLVLEGRGRRVLRRRRRTACCISKRPLALLTGAVSELSGQLP